MRSANVPNQKYLIMTIYTNTQEIKTERGTLIISKTFEKFARVGFWRVEYLRNGATLAEVIKSDLLNKPTKRQISNYILNLGL